MQPPQVVTSILLLDKQLEGENSKGEFLLLSVCPVSIKGKTLARENLGNGWYWERVQDPRKSRKESGYGKAPSTSLGKARKEAG